MNNPIVGQTMYLCDERDYNARNGLEATLTKIGTKYYTVVRQFREFRFHKDDLVEETNWGTRHRLYFSKQEMLDDFESVDLIKQLKNFLGKCTKTYQPTATLDQLRRMKAIADETQTKRMDS